MDDKDRLMEDIILLGDSVQDALYHGSRMQRMEYDHLVEDTLKEVRDVKRLSEEILERHEEE